MKVCGKVPETRKLQGRGERAERQRKAWLGSELALRQRGQWHPGATSAHKCSALHPNAEAHATPVYTGDWTEGTAVRT